jgi:hypothetical protein
MVHFALMWVHPWSRATRFWASPLESPDQIQVVSRHSPKTEFISRGRSVTTEWTPGTIPI